MIEGLLARDEGKTLEFKENCRPLDRIVRTAVAFANTAGGTVVIGVKDKTREVTGVADPLTDEGRLANAFAENIRPLLIPDIQVHAWRSCQVPVVIVPHAFGPYFVRSEGPEADVYVRLGSSNRPAGPLPLPTSPVHWPAPPEPKSPLPPFAKRGSEVGCTQRAVRTPSEAVSRKHRLPSSHGTAWCRLLTVKRARITPL